MEMNITGNGNVAVQGTQFKPQGLNVEKMFAYKHLPEDKAKVSKIFHDAAVAFDEITEGCAEKTLCLRELWIAKNTAVLANSDWK